MLFFQTWFKKPLLSIAVIIKDPDNISDYNAILSRKNLRFDQEQIHFLGPVYPYYQRFFNIRRTAGAGSKADKRRQLVTIFVFYSLQGVFQIIDHLAGVSNTNMDRGIYAYRSPPLSCAALSTIVPVLATRYSHPVMDTSQSARPVFTRRSANCPQKGLSVYLLHNTP